jgi:hypothetical protein
MRKVNKKLQDDTFVSIGFTNTYYIALTVSSVFGIMYVIASFFPDSFLWGVHQLAFFDVPTRFILIAFVIVLTLPPVSSRIINLLEKIVEWHVSKFWKAIVFSLVIGIAGIFLFQHFSIALDMYGDTTKITNYAASREWSFADVFNYKENEPLTYLSYKLIMMVSGVDWKTAFYNVSVGSGGVFLFLLFLFVFFLEGSALWKIFFAMLWLTSGINQNFFGHMENYSLVYLFNFFILFLAYQLFTGKKVLSVLLIIFLIGIRVHLETILLLPAILYAIVYSAKERFPKLQQWLQPKYIMGFVFVTLLFGVWAYFFHFQAYHYTTTAFEERAGKLFLPLINPLPAPHSYSLLSLNHLSDVVQEILYTTSPIAIIFILLSVIVFKRIRWSEPRMIFFLLASFYFLLFNLTINPIQSPPRDWDFVCLAAVPINFLAITLSAQLFQLVKEKSVQQKILAFAIAPALLSSTIFLVNASETKISKRLASLGEWTFKSYYYGSTYMINVGLRTITDIDTQIAEREKTISDLISSKSMSDLQFGVLYEHLGYAYYRKKDYENSYQSFSKALKEDEENTRLMAIMANAAILTYRFDSASELLATYNETENDPEITDWRALMSAEFTNTLSYLSIFEKDTTIIRDDLEEFEKDSYSAFIDFMNANSLPFESKSK